MPGPPQCGHDRRLGLRVGGGRDLREKLAVILCDICDTVTRDVAVDVVVVVAVAVSCGGMKCCTGRLLAR